MKITIINELEEYVVTYDHRSIRIEKPVTLEEVKKTAREHFNAVGEKVNWEIIR